MPEQPFIQAGSAGLLYRLASEPLLQFLLAGALLLSIQQMVTPARARAVSSESIHISQQAVESMKAAFAQENSRVPTEAETRDMILKHVDGEVLYREAMRYGLDRTDVIVRREMQRKMRFLIEDVVPLTEPTHAQLQAWLDAHADNYARPQRISFQQVFLSRAKHGKDLEYNAGRVLAQLQTDPESYRDLSDPFPAGLDIEQADETRLLKLFGSTLATVVFDLDGEQWNQPIRSSLGVHIVRITDRLAPMPVTVEQAGKRLINDYQQAQREEANRQALEKMRTRYEIAIEDAS